MRESLMCSSHHFSHASLQNNDTTFGQSELFFFLLTKEGPEVSDEFIADLLVVDRRR